MVSKASNVRITTLISEISSCFITLDQVQDLNPSPQVNALFGKLVSLCLQTPGEEITNQVTLLSFPELNGNGHLLTKLCQILQDLRIVQIIPRLRQICSDAECRLEAFWVEKILRLDTKDEGGWLSFLSTLSFWLLL